MDFLRVDGIEIYKNCIVKKYPSGRCEYLVADAPVFREPGWEASEGQRQRAHERSGARADAEDMERSRRRARSMIAEYGFANDFSHFVTFTLDGAVIERYDIAEIMKRLRAWLSNAVQRQGLKYVLVPERHKKGGIHFHGLVCGELALTDSGTLKVEGKARPYKPRSEAERRRLICEGARVVYNVADWPFGFSTAMELYGDYSAAVGYVCKYIGKDAEKIGGRWYYSGGGLSRADRVYRAASFEEAAERGETFEIRRLGCRCVKYVEVDDVGD